MANSAGLVNIFDGGCPRIIGGKARADTSGGEFMYASGANNSVSSGINSFATTDLLFANDASGGEVNGVAVFNVNSGGDVAVMTRGAIIAVANGAVTPGQVVGVDGSNAIANAGSVDGNLAHQRIVGRALTGAASGGHAIVHLNL